MKGFYRDIDNLLNAHDTNWDDYLIIREQFEKKYNVADDLEPIGYYNGEHGFLHDEFDKDCYCQGGCSMEEVYTESQLRGFREKINVVEDILRKSEEAYQKQTDRFFNSELNESARSHCENQLKLLYPAHKAYQELLKIGE